MNKARKIQADLFISLHADSFRNSQASGSSVYALSTRGATSEAAKLLAQKENAVDLFGKVSLNDKDDMLASVLLDMSQDSTIQASLDVGEHVLKSLSTVGRVHKKSVQQAGFVVLKSPDIPSILIESAFISNLKEEKKLKSKYHQRRLAKAVTKGVKYFFKEQSLPGTYLAS
jgi:N-acetylmuramoyl-L-alanine amidase